MPNYRNTMQKHHSGVFLQVGVAYAVPVHPTTGCPVRNWKPLSVSTSRLSNRGQQKIKSYDGHLALSLQAVKSDGKFLFSMRGVNGSGAMSHGVSKVSCVKCSMDNASSGLWSVIRLPSIA